MKKNHICDSISTKNRRLKSLLSNFIHNIYHHHTITFPVQCNFCLINFSFLLAHNFEDIDCYFGSFCTHIQRLFFFLYSSLVTKVSYTNI